MKKRIAGVMAALVCAASGVLMGSSGSPAASSLPTLVVVGDSITAGWYLPAPWRDAWPAIMQRETYASLSVQNDGQGGQCVEQECGGIPSIESQFPSLIAQPGVGGAIIAGGVNDLGNMPNGWWALPIAFDSMMKECIAAHIECWLATIPPQASSWYPTMSAAEHANIEAIREAVNAWMFEAYPGQVIDFSAVLSDGQNQMYDEFAMPDGLHPNYIGEFEMSEMLPLDQLRGLS